MENYNFKFRLSQELINGVGYDIEYEAKEGEGEFIQVWFQEPGEDEDYVLYEKEMVEQCINDGSWIIQD